ncbi:hypothetical protein GQ457_08G016360 [Hibiscus cannabinus]
MLMCMIKELGYAVAYWMMKQNGNVVANLMGTEKTKLEKIFSPHSQPTLHVKHAPSHRDHWTCAPAPARETCAQQPGPLGSCTYSCTQPLGPLGLCTCPYAWHLQPATLRGP